MLRTLKRIASRLPSGWQLALRRHWYTCRLRLGLFKDEEPEYQRLSEWVGVGDCVIDIGANIGLYTASLSELVGPAGHVFAFEPVPETFGLLAFNSRLFAHQNVTLLNAAASDSAGLVQMEVPSAEGGLPNIYLARITEKQTGTAVFAVPVDALTIHARVSFVKIDVEGHEYSVLKGMEELLKEHTPTIVVEGNDEAVADLLGRLGFVSHQYADSPNMVYRHLGRGAAPSTERVIGTAR